MGLDCSKHPPGYYLVGGGQGVLGWLIVGRVTGSGEKGKMRKPGLKGISLRDQRDIAYTQSLRRTLLSVECAPPVKDLISSPVADQEDLGSCGSFAAVYNLVGKMVQNNEEEWVNLSQLFLYYAYREQFGNVNSDDGVLLRDLLKILASVGVCSEEKWPYLLKNFSKKPPKAAYEEAKAHSIKSYHALYTISDMIQCIASGYGFIGGIGCYESFDSLKTERTGIVALPGREEKLLGWHALNFCRYNLNTGMIGFENSYGKEWGIKGYGWIPIDYLRNPHLADDFWTIRF